MIYFSVLNLLYSLKSAVQFTICCTGYNLLHSLQSAVQVTICCTVYNLLYSLQPDVQFTICCTVYNLLYSLQSAVHFAICCTVYNHTVHFTILRTRCVQATFALYCTMHEKVILTNFKDSFYSLLSQANPSM